MAPLLLKGFTSACRINGMKTFVFFFVLSGLLAFASEQDPKPTAKSILKEDGGYAPHTAKLTNFPYRQYLRAAVRKREAGLRQLFRFTDTESFIGAGAESHAAVLRDFLRYWGDREFSRALRKETPKVRQAVIWALDYTWPYPGWQETEYPRTHRLASHEKTEDY